MEATQRQLLNDFKQQFELPDVESLTFKDHVTKGDQRLHQFTGKVNPFSLSSKIFQNMHETKHDFEA